MRPAGSGDGRALARLHVISGHVAPGGEREISMEEVAQHNSAKSMWIVVDGVVYDMTPFLSEHPGGKRIPLKYAGTDASEVWHSMHRPEIMAEYGRELRIGLLAGSRRPAGVGSAGGGAGSSAPGGTRDAARYAAALRQCAAELRAFVDDENCHPILVRLAWHDSGTFDRALAHRWPACGGANGSIRFERELAHGANAGLKKAVLYLQPFKEKFAELSWADLIQLGGAISLELAGALPSPMRYGRVDVASEEECPPEGRLPSAYPPFPGDVDAPTHLRQVFGRMGFSDAEIVALSGAHTLGRAFKERSGVVEEGYGRGKGTRHTQPPTGRARADGSTALGMPGGKSWTERWLAFDNSYYAYAGHAADPALLWMPTDAALHEDAHFRGAYERCALGRGRAARRERHAPALGPSPPRALPRARPVRHAPAAPRAGTRPTRARSASTLRRRTPSCPSSARASTRRRALCCDGGLVRAAAAWRARRSIECHSQRKGRQQ